MTVKSRTHLRRCTIARVRMFRRCVIARAKMLLPAQQIPLLASMVLNIVFVTQIVASAFSDGVQEISMHVPKVPEMISVSAQGLSRKDADVLSQLVSAGEMTFAPTQYAYRRSLVRLISVIGQPRLDKEELRAALNEVRKEQIRMEDAALEIYREALEQFSHEARREVVHQLSLRW